MLQSNDGLEFGLGHMQWELAGTLLLGWFIVYCIIRFIYTIAINYALNPRPNSLLIKGAASTRAAT